MTVWSSFQLACMPFYFPSMFFEKFFYLFLKTPDVTTNHMPEWSILLYLSLFFFSLFHMQFCQNRKFYCSFEMVAFLYFVLWWYELLLVEIDQRVSNHSSRDWHLCWALASTLYQITFAFIVLLYLLIGMGYSELSYFILSRIYLFYTLYCIIEKFIVSLLKKGWTGHAVASWSTYWMELLCHDSFLDDNSQIKWFSSCGGNFLVFCC